MPDVPEGLSREVLNILHFTHSHAHTARRFRGQTYRLQIDLKHDDRGIPLFRSMEIRATNGEQNAHPAVIRPRKTDRRHLGEFVFLLAAKLKYDLLRNYEYDGAGFLHSDEIARMCQRGLTGVPASVYAGLRTLWRNARSRDGQYYQFLRSFLASPDQLWHLVCFCGQTSAVADSQSLVWWLNVCPDDVSFVCENNTEALTGDNLKNSLARLFPESVLLDKQSWNAFLSVLEGSSVAGWQQPSDECHVYDPSVSVRGGPGQVIAATGSAIGQLSDAHCSLTEEVLSYLKKLAKECGRLPHYFPRRLRESRSGKTLLDRIRPVVRVVEDRRAFDKWLAQERERLRRQGHGGNALAYGPHRGMPGERDGQGLHDSSAKTFRWDDRAGERFQQAVILGDPGFGKTWLLRYEARRLAHRAMDELADSTRNLDRVELPIFMRLPDMASLVSEKKTLVDIVVELRGKGRSDAFRDYLRRQLISGHGVVLLDAWDEISDLNRRQQLRDLIANFSETSVGRMLLTSRSMDYDLTPPPLPNGEKLAMMPWNWHQIESFIRVWFESEKSYVEQFVSELEQHPRCHALARIPLMLQFLCQVYPDADLPSQRSELYRNCLWRLFRDWQIQDKKNIIKGKYELSETYIGGLIEALESLALELHIRGLKQFYEEDVRSILVSFFKEISKDSCLHELQAEEATPTKIMEHFKDCGILVPSANTGPRKLQFLDLTFQEYLAARAIAKREDCADVALKHVYDPAWNHVLIMLGSITRQVRKYVATLLRANREDVICRPFMLAIQVIAESDQEQWTKRFLNTLFDELFEIYFERSNAFLSREVKGKMTMLPEAERHLISKLPNCRKEDCVLVIEAIGELGTDQAVKPLVDALNTNEVRWRTPSPVSEQSVLCRVWTAMWTFVHDPDGRIQGIVSATRQLEELRDNLVREQIVREIVIALDSIQSTQAVQALIRILLNDQDYCTRIEAVSALESIRSEEAVEPLIKILKDQDQDMVVRSRVALALASIGSEDAVESLICARDDQSENVRLAARVGLHKVGSDKIVEPLTRALKDPDRDVRRNAAFALADSIVSDQAVEPLIEALKDPDSQVRSNVALALGSTDSNKAVEPLIKVLKDQDSKVRCNAALALGSIGSNQALASLALESLLREMKEGESAGSSNEYLTAVLKGLGKIGSTQAVEAITAAMKDQGQDVVVRKEAVEVLHEIDSAEAFNAIIMALEDQNSEIRTSAAKAFCLIRSDQAVKPLIKALKDSDRDARSVVAYALGVIGSDQAVEPLMEALKDPDKDVRGEAAVALGSIGSNRATEPLIKALDDEDEDVRREVAYALGLIGSDQAVRPLIEALKEQDSEIRCDVSRFWETTSAVALLSKMTSIQHEIQTVEPFFKQLTERKNLGLSRSITDILKVLGKIGSAEAIEAIMMTLKDLKDHGWDVRICSDAIEVLRTIGSDEAFNAIIEALKSSNYFVRARAAAALGSIGSDRAVEPLVNALKDQHEFVREEAASALGSIGSDQAVDPLIMALNDKWSEVRSHVLDSLRRISKKEGISMKKYKIPQEIRHELHSLNKSMGHLAKDL